MVNNLYKDKKGRYEIKTIKIEHVDGAVFDYFDKKLAPTVEKESAEGTLYSAKVMVEFAAGERWALIRKNKFRDEKGTLILPIISIRRTDISRKMDMGGMPSAQKSITISKKIHPKTSNIQNQIETRRNAGLVYQQPRSAIMETLTIPFPDFCTITYEITLWSDYNQHMNEILEKMFSNYENVGGRVDSVVMPIEYDGNEPKGDSYYFVGLPENSVVKQSNDDDFTGQERIVKYVLTMQVPTYLMLDPDDEALSYGEDEGGKKIVYKKQSVNKIKLKEEILSLEDFEKLYG